MTISAYDRADPRTGAARVRPLAIVLLIAAGCTSGPRETGPTPEVESSIVSSQSSATGGSSAECASVDPGSADVDLLEQDGAALWEEIDNNRGGAAALVQLYNADLAGVFVGTCEEAFGVVCEQRGFECIVLFRDGVLITEPAGDRDWRKWYVTVVDGRIDTIEASL